MEEMEAWKDLIEFVDLLMARPEKWEQVRELLKPFSPHPESVAERSDKPT